MFLYDTSHNDYKNLVKKAEARGEIAAELGMTSKYFGNICCYALYMTISITAVFVKIAAIQEVGFSRSCTSLSLIHIYRSWLVVITVYSEGQEQDL